METVHLPHLHDHPLQVCLFRQVRNAAFLRQQLLDGNSDFEYAFLDASVLLSRAHVFAACFRAINDLANNRLRTKNVHSEIVFALSPNNNIAESFRRFGISETSQDLVAIKITDDASGTQAFLNQHVEGEAVSFSDSVLQDISEASKIRKLYRLEAPKKGEPASKLGPGAESFILGSMALKGS